MTIKGAIKWADGEGNILCMLAFINSDAFIFASTALSVVNIYRL